MNVSKIERLAALLGAGGKAKIAKICGVDPAMVTRWARLGHVPAKYNTAMRIGLSKQLGADDYRTAVKCLIPDECPECGRRLPQK